MAQKYPAPFGREKARKNGPLIVRGPWRRHPDLNRRIGDLQSPALPLGYGAVVAALLQVPILPLREWGKISTFRNTLLSKPNHSVL